MRTALLTLVALCAFAGNSILCRMALARPAIDPASFTLIRIAAGATTLALIVLVTTRRAPSVDRRAWGSGFWLFAYAIAFAWAYLALGAGAGALILFGAVQLTMIALATVRGERPTAPQVTGIALAFGGLAYLVAPRVAAPPLVPALAMMLAGVAWGVYSLRARGVTDPLAATAANFVAAVPMAMATLCVALALDAIHIERTGAWLAVVSGAVTSGAGYVVWYAALRGLRAMHAAVVQLAVPAIAALGGLVWLGERMTWHLLGAGATILAGIAVVLMAAPRPAPQSSTTREAR